MLGQCNLLALEDKTARSLGVNVTRNRIGRFGDRGTFSFHQYGHHRPHQLFGADRPPYCPAAGGSNHKVLAPYSILLGAFTLLLADTLGRIIAAPL